MAQEYKMLIEALREKCRKDRWYGPELLNIRAYEGIEERDPSFDQATLASIDWNDPNLSGFVFPPASEETLKETEDQLGFPLPLLLRMLYSQIANGGFGPGTGLRGVYDGYGKVGTSVYPN